jgi:asparagine synthase (glutamine-hydrolysing)
MGGLCGIYSPRHPRYVTEEILQQMLGAFQHAGVACRQTFVHEAEGIALGQYYASPFPTTSPPEVPNWHEDEAYVGALDGQIFHDAVLLPPALRSHYRWAEVGTLIACFAQLPATAPAQIDGEYRMALWDKQAKSLWVGCDALGRQPLYYAHVAESGLFVFASEPKAILRHPQMQRQVSHDGLAAYMAFGYVPAPLCIFEGLRKVLRGEVLHVDRDGALTRRRFWSVPEYRPETRSLSNFAADVRATVLEAVAKYYRRNQQVGVHFSAGLDSTVIVGALKLLGASPVDALTMAIHSDYARAGMTEDLDWARRFAARLGIRLHAIELPREHNPLPHLCTILPQFHEPMNIPHIESQYILGLAAQRAGITECYTGMDWGGLLSVETAAKRAKLAQIFADHASLPDEDARIVKAYATGVDVARQQTVLKHTTIDMPALGKQILTPFLGALHTGSPWERYYAAGVHMRPNRNIGFQMHYAALTGVHVRNPFYDVPLICLDRTIPERLKGSESDAMGKAVLKLAFQDVLPQEIVTRKKVGYPGYFWDKEIQQLKGYFLSQEAIERTGLLRYTAVHKLLTRHAHAKKRQANSTVWGLILLQAWYELHMHENTAVLTQFVKA